LRNSSLWWNGPNWLQHEDTSWPRCEEIAETSTEEKQAKPSRMISLLTQPSDE